MFFFTVFFRILYPRFTVHLLMHFTFYTNALIYKCAVSKFAIRELATPASRKPRLNDAEFSHAARIPMFRPEHKPQMAIFTWHRTFELSCSCCTLAERSGRILMTFPGILLPCRQATWRSSALLVETLACGQSVSRSGHQP